MMSFFWQVSRYQPSYVFRLYQRYRNEFSPTCTTFCWLWNTSSW